MSLDLLRVRSESQ